MNPPMERSRPTVTDHHFVDRPWGRAMRHDVRRINYWTREEIHWMRTLGKSTLEADKFNPGQKLNAIFVGVSVLVSSSPGQCCSGSGSFPCRGDRGRPSSMTFVAWAVFSWSLVISSWPSPTATRCVRSFKGWVSRSWAERYAARWIQEEPSGELKH